MDRSRHTLNMYLNDENKDAVNNRKLLKKLDPVSNSLYEVELAKEQNEHVELLLSAFSSFNTLNYEGWNSATTFPPNFVT